MTRVTTLIGAAFLILLALGGTAALAQHDTLDGPTAGDAPVTPRASAPRKFIESHCIKCHSEEASTAMALFSGLFLDRVDVDNVHEAPVVWEKVVLKLRTGMMPPSTEPRPDAAAKQEFLTYLESELDRLAAEHPIPGRPALHRLNRVEYRNAIRDLLALDVDAEALLPADDSSVGFDNIAAALGVSPVLIERFAGAAAKISRLAVGNPSMEPERKPYYVSGLLTQTGHLPGMPFGTRGGLRVEHYFPLDGDYTVGVDLIGDDGGAMGKNAANEELELSIDGVRVALFDLSPERPRRGAEERDRDDSAEAEDTEAEDTNEAEETAEAEDTVEAEEAEEAAAEPEPRPDAELLARKKAERFEVTVPLAAGPHEVVATFVRKNHAPVEDLFQPHANVLLDPLLDSSPDVMTMFPHVSSVTVTGPYAATGPGDTPSRRAIFTCRPAEGTDGAACARQILETLATRAYRQPVGVEDLSILMDFYAQGREEGGFERGVELALQRILSSPQFLFRFERAPADAASGEPYRLSGLELASRLSFFLWSSLPDDELLDAAVRGQLDRPSELRKETLRMLADPRSSALTENFAGQWLHLRNLDIKTASTIEFPDFDDNLRNAFRTETEMLFEHIKTQDLSVLELLTANYTFVNERLARHYGIPDVYGSHFRRVPVTAERRRGLLGHGSVLLVTSQPNRTSPVNRGVWILETILGAEVPSPPMATPPLEEAAGDADIREMSVRELMELHRAKPFCEGCHKIMDPVGLAMENYDVIGRWREYDGDMRVDATGRLVDGSEIDGPAELRAALLRYSDQIVRNMTEKMLTYAVGRPLDYYDMPVVRRIADEAAENDYRFSSIVLGIVTSTPFLMRSPADRAEATVAADTEQARR